MKSPAHNKYNKYDAYKWIQRVIDSCITYPQLVVADRLIRLHFTMFGDEYLRNSLNAYHEWAEDNLIKNAEIEDDDKVGDEDNKDLINEID